MAIYHCSIKNISRSSGRSAIASAAYRAGAKLQDNETGLTHDYTRKKEVAYSAVMLPENAPQEYLDRETLWNAVSEVEKQSNARLAREWEVAIPNELTLEQSKELINGFAKSLADEGMCVDVNIHWKDGNHHAHIMGTTRAIKENGAWAPKSRKVYDLDEQGQKIPQIDRKTGKQKVDKQNRKQWQNHKEDYTDWNKEEKIEEWRERWAEHCNRYLEKEQRIDHRSFERQGVELIPTIHEGQVAREMERKGQVAERCEINRDIAAANTQLNELERKRSVLARLLRRLVKLLNKKIEEALNERLQRLRATRTADDTAGRNADGNRRIQADYSRTTERAVEASRTISELITSARTDIDSATAAEQDSATDRADREAARERLNLARKQQAQKAQQRLANRKPRRSSQDYEL